MFTIINEIGMVDGQIVYNQLGYTLSTDNINTININYDNTLGVWIETNKEELEAGTKDISEFFEVTPSILIARTIVSNNEGLNEIIDL